MPEKRKGALQGFTKGTQKEHKGSTGYTGWMMVGQGGAWAGGCRGIRQGWTGWMLHLASQRQSHGQLT